MRLSLSRWRKIAFLPVYSLLFAGCAVLNVEVDVYKGPLANHKDIQLEQIAAMAVAAKPLLHELSYQLESKWRRENCGRNQYMINDRVLRKSNPAVRHDGTDTLVCEQKVYFSGLGNPFQFMDPGVNKAFEQKGNPSGFIQEKYVYGSQQARKVNALLELYEERSPENFALTQISKRAKLIDDSYKSYRRISPANVWTEYEKNLSKNTKEKLEECPEPWPEMHFDGQERITDVEQMFDRHHMEIGHYKAHDYLVCGYREYFLSQEERGWRLSRQFQRKLYEESEGAHKKYFLSTNGAYLWLSNPLNVEKHARNLFGPCEKEKKTECIHSKFIGDVTDTAKSFIDSRYGVRDLYLYSLRLLRQIHEETGQRNSAIYSTNSIYQHDNHINDSLIRLVARLIDYSDVLMTVNTLVLNKQLKGAENANSTLLDSSGALISRIKDNPLFDMLKGVSECYIDAPFIPGEFQEDKDHLFCDTKNNRESAKQVITRGLYHQPSEAAHLLSLLDELLLIHSASNGQKCSAWTKSCIREKGVDPTQVKGPYEHLMGTVVGANEVLDSLNNTFLSTTSTLLASTSLGLEKGRRDRGLSDQIEKFLSDRDRLGSAHFNGVGSELYPEGYTKTKQLLLNSLEEFAQKLLVIANNTLLFSLDS